ncbi:MAG: cyclase family protein, partial [Thermomicrobiales bacterium]|nr:cyclase family protein [Thermomicrobiales bacterium]
MPITPTTRIHDVTLTLSARFPVWPGDNPIELAPVSRIADGASSNVTRISIPSHCGTHVDPPRHYIDGGAAMDQIPLERWSGPCQVIEIEQSVDRIEPAHLESAGIAEGTTRLLFKTRNSAHWSREPIAFATDYVALSKAAAQWIVQRGVALIGIDALSFEPFDDDEEGAVHRIILGNGVLAIEGLDLREVGPGH